MQLEDDCAMPCPRCPEGAGDGFCWSREGHDGAHRGECGHVWKQER